MNILRPYILFGTALILSAVSAHGQLASYKAEIYSYIHEDGSAARKIVLNFSRDEKDLAVAKRAFFTGQGYKVYDFPDNENYFLVAEKTWEGELSDDFAVSKIRIQNHGYTFEDKFLTNLVRKDVEISGLQNDFATAKVILADLQFTFYTIMPGRITESSSGDIRNDTTQWTYDVEQLIHHDYFEMSATSVLDRQDSAIWYVFFAGLLVTCISALLFVKVRIRKSSEPVVEKPVD